MGTDLVYRCSKDGEHQTTAAQIGAAHLLQLTQHTIGMGPTNTSAARADITLFK